MVKNASLLFDTAVYIGFQNQVKIIEPGWLSMVVIQELMAGSSGRSDLKYWENMSRYYTRKNRLLTPNDEAWRTAGRILNHLLSDLSRNDAGRRRPKLSNDKKQSIIRDVLIAVSAKQHGVTVISDNEDFPLLLDYYDFRWQSAHSFFAGT
ncbi:MAG: hypothetical protein HOP19_28585 [Acidobacteria bacterium]|nr:hypothetical protein [Acidobacteriota bacterium]